MQNNKIYKLEKSFFFMEKLEEISTKGKIDLEDSTKTYEPLYKGLELVEEKSFNGGTSIKYWM